jgi:hypothetical protein
VELFLSDLADGTDGDRELGPSNGRFLRMARCERPGRSPHTARQHAIKYIIFIISIKFIKIDFLPLVNGGQEGKIVAYGSGTGGEPPEPGGQKRNAWTKKF